MKLPQLANLPFKRKNGEVLIIFHGIWYDINQNSTEKLILMTLMQMLEGRGFEPHRRHCAVSLSKTR